MGSLNPEWLAIELDSIDATVESWSEAIQASYKAAIESVQAKPATEKPLASVASLADAL